MTGSDEPGAPPRAALEAALRDGRLPAGASVLVALSGGRDSASLLHALHRVGAWRLSALTIDHGLHSDSSAHARRALAFARKLGVPAASVAVDAARSTDGPGPEAAARRARYRALAAHADAIGAERIVTAHTADDQAETLLMRLGEGTGLRGLGGIPPHRGRYVRPWLGVSRAAVAEYARIHRIPHVDDPSNADLRFLRNAVRHRVLPPMAGCFDAGWVERAAATAHRARGAHALLSWLLARAPGVVTIDEDGAVVRLDQLDGLPPDGRAALIDCALDGALARWAPGHRRRRALHVDRLAALGPGQGCGLPGELAARRHGDRLHIYIVSPAPEPPPPLRVEASGRHRWGSWIFEVTPGTWTGPGQGVALTRAEAPLPWIIRPVRSGERLHPRGAPGHKAIRRLWSDRGVAPALREALPVIESAGRVVWAAGLRAAEQVRATPGASVWWVTVLPPPEARWAARGAAADARHDAAHDE